MTKNQLTGEDKEYADKFLNRFGSVVLNEIISHSQIILTDLSIGALHANNFEEYRSKQPDCAQFLLKIIIDNMAANMEQEPVTIH